MTMTDRQRLIASLPGGKADFDAIPDAKPRVTSSKASRPRHKVDCGRPATKSERLQLIEHSCLAPALQSTDKVLLHLIMTKYNFPNGAFPNLETLAGDLRLNERS